jgi:hypothetical protein
MNRAIAAALLSGLVFPGAGHLYLRRPRRACLFLVPTLLAAVVYVGDMAQRVSSTVDQVMSGAVAPTTAAIAAQLETQGPHSALVTASAVVLVVCWLGSIADSFVVARGARKAPG